jgi:hypothetical protein
MIAEPTAALPVLVTVAAMVPAVSRSASPTDL